MFPTYYGSPFVFKDKSLGSSMEYYYSISGPGLIEKPCERIWEGGPTLCECIQRMLKEFAEFITKEKQTKL